MAMWIYDATENRLLRQADGERLEVSLSPQQHRLVAYMAARNHEAGGKPVLCSRDELIAAIWGDEPDHLPQDLAYLVHQLRARLGTDPGEVPLIVNERGRGYRLEALDAEGMAFSPPATESSFTAPGTSRRWLLRLALAATLALAGGGAVFAATRPRPAEPILREGNHGEDVLALQRDLADAGYDPVYQDGQFGPLTARAVRAFQQDRGLVVDGEVGPETRAALRQRRPK